MPPFSNFRDQRARWRGREGHMERVAGTHQGGRKDQHGGLREIKHGLTALRPGVSVGLELEELQQDLRLLVGPHIQSHGRCRKDREDVGEAARGIPRQRLDDGLRTLGRHVEQRRELIPRESETWQGEEGRE